MNSGLLRAGFFLPRQLDVIHLLGDDRRPPGSGNNLNADHLPASTQIGFLEKGTATH